MKTYKETKAEIKKLVVQFGLDGILGKHIVELLNHGHNGTNIQNAISYFKFSAQTVKYR